MGTTHEKDIISIIVPAYLQEKTIIKDITRIRQVMEKTPYRYEIIVVVDGKIDKTFEKAKKIKARNITITGYNHNHGKGYAVRYGMAKAKGSLIAFIDAGMDLHPKGLSLLIEKMTTNNADIVIASKLHPHSKVNYPFSRKILSFGYRTLVKLFFGLSVSDTQVGLKLFKRKVLEHVLPRLLVKQYAFDIEILAVAYRLGYKKIYESPVELIFQNISSITSKSFWHISFRMLWDTTAVFYRLKLRRYYDDRNKRKWKYDPELNFKVNTG